MKGFAEGGSYLLVGCPYCICYTSKDAFSTCFSLVSFSWLTRENPQPDRSFFLKFWAGSPERIRSCRVERRRILRSCWVHPRLACCFWAPFFLALLLTRYVVWAARYLATQHVAVLQVLAQVQMKPRWQNSAVEMQMALSPKSCPTAASETTTFSVASMPTILWIVWKRTLVSLLTVALVLWLPQDMVQTTANGPACGVPGAAKAAWTVLGRRMKSHSNVQEWKFPRQLFAGELFVSQFASNACTGLLTELACLKSFVAGKAQAIAGCSKAQMNLCPFVPESFVAQQMMESKRPLLIGLESFEHSASSNRAKDKCKCAPLF